MLGHNAVTSSNLSKLFSFLNPDSYIKIILLF